MKWSFISHVRTALRAMHSGSDNITQRLGIAIEPTLECA
jgi:hypothetical protein